MAKVMPQRLELKRNFCIASAAFALSLGNRTYAAPVLFPAITEVQNLSVHLPESHPPLS